MINYYCILSFLIVSFTTNQDQKIELHLIINNSESFGIEQVAIRYKKDTITNLVSDKNDVFIIPRKLISDSNDYDVILTSLIGNGIYLTTLNTFSPDKIEISLPRTYQMRFGRAICPKCQKIKDVYRITHSEAPIMVRKIVNGDTIYSPIYRRSYSQGDVYSDFDPKWYCKKDDIFY